MRLRTRLLFFLALVSCGDPPTAPGREVLVAFCFPPLWAGYRNEGEPWRQLELPFGVARLTDRVAIATVRSGMSMGTVLSVQYLTSEQVESTFRCTSGDPGKTVHATISGAGNGDQVYAMLGSSIGVRTAAGPLTFTGVPAGPLDFVATRQVFEPDRVRVPSVIVRRAQDIAFGASLAPVDFASAEAVTPLEHTITFTEMQPATQFGLQVDFLTGSETLTPIGGGSGSGATATGFSLPPSILVPTDLHLMIAGAHAPAVDRSFIYFYRSGADRTHSFGPVPNAPVFAAPPADAVLRASIPSQAEYGARVGLYTWAEGHTAELTATREHFGGTPAAWTIDVPNLRGTPGFQDAWHFPAASVDWILTVTGQPYGFSTKDGRDGDLFRTAHRRSP